MSASSCCAPELEFPIVSREQLAAAWGWLFNTMRQHSRRLFGDQSWSEDVVQETLLCLWRDLAQNSLSFAGRAQLLGWLRTAQVRQGLKAKGAGADYVPGSCTDDSEYFDALPGRERFQGRIAPTDELARLREISAVVEQLSPMERASFERFMGNSSRSKMTTTERSQRRRMLVRLRQLLKKHGFRA